MELILEPKLAQPSFPSFMNSNQHTSLSSFSRNNQIRSFQLLLLFLLTLQSAHADQVGWWKLNETTGSVAIDSSGTGNNGAVTTASSASGSPSWVNDTTRGKVLALDKHGDVRIDTSYPSLTNAMSIAFWVKGNSSLSKSTAFTAMDGSAIRFRAQIPRRNREVRLTTTAGSHSYNTATTDNLKHEWRHWVFLVDGTTKKYSIYLNGVLESSGKFEGATFTFSDIDTIRIGSNQGSGQFYDGRMSDFRLYDHALTYAEVQNIFEPKNAAPVAVNDSYIAEKNTLRSIMAPGVLGNDSDQNGDTITSKLVTDAQNGTLNLAADGSFTYLPNVDFIGTDQFTYKVNDSTEDSTTATVIITVTEPGMNGITIEELQKISNDLGVTLTIDEQLSLSAIVKPSASTQWRTEAEARINQHRKADFNAIIVDSNGVPVVGAKVDIKLRKKQFRFGGIMNLKKFAGETAMDVTTDKYKSLFLKYYDHAGLDNGLKPKLRAGNEDLLPAYFTWLAENKMETRGHLLMWPGGTHMSTNIDLLVTSIENEADLVVIETLKTQLRTAINAEITGWAASWDVTEWDVVNELLSNHRVQDILGQSEIVSWFNLARNNAVQSDAKLLINEFQIISAKSTGNSYTARSADYKAEIDFLVNNNAELDKIGFQSRYKFDHPDPAVLYSRMQDFAAYNLPMVGTEFEIIDLAPFSPSENERAEMTEEIMTIYYSHPQMEGLFSWDFLTSDSVGALVNGDGTPKLNGLVWYYLNRIRYNTETTTTTDASGAITFNGYKGEYDLEVTINGQSYLTQADLTADGLVEIAIVSTSIGTILHTSNTIEDAHCRESIPDSNFGSDTRLQLRSDPLSSFTRHVFLKFDISGLQGAATNTRLRLYSDDLTSVVEAYAVHDNTWKQKSITWNNKPTLGNLIGSATGRPSTSLDIDLGNYVTSDGLITIALKSTENTMFKLFSSESISPPQLLITSDTSLAPTGQSDSYSLKQNGIIQQPVAGVLTNDTNLGSGNMTATLIQDVSFGSLNLLTDGSFTYTPDAGFWGWDSFTYQATNSAGSSTTQTVSLGVARNFIDTDNDGLEDSWEITHVGDLTTMARTTDTDGDGHLDIDEYLSKTDPNNPADKFHVIGLTSVAAGQLTLKWSSKTGLRYRVQRSANLTIDSWVTELDQIQAKGNTTSINLNSTRDRNFYRVQVIDP